MTTTGLLGSVVYDVPNYSTTLNLVNVSALVFQADCKAVPQARQNGTVDAQDPGYFIHIDDSLEDFGVALSA
ncbi:uncharacterized protein PHACADRAFT_254128 [Phanerochaete carnosa HHB-10118-sp]|uniref:Uncharacterized protein n=1 Tax=Phanerochaete carnosa (strain HHB-10118-sp) TaxID=650164 RepID=K5WC82_PHACS|nr:uncharacterized protein PHACADRAFT_254128 [Phanerochaete carnosa HHB-10118-sp]EKM56805.1 hypothetical protein PHACADRAFT_254128 [Phanerochaete carnosa HHB-10118-sp]